jgi:hypothetical protein
MRLSEDEVGCIVRSTPSTVRVGGASRYVYWCTDVEGQCRKIMDGIDGLRDALGAPDYLQRVLIAYAIVLGLEAPFVLFVASMRRRPWYEQALVLVPTAGFGLGLYWARQARDTLAAIQSYLAFTGYPYAQWPTFAQNHSAEAQALVASMQQHVVAMGGLTLVSLLGGWVLLMRWASMPVPQYAADSALAAAQLSGSEPGADDEQENLEITIEPIEKQKR